MITNQKLTLSQAEAIRAEHLELLKQHAALVRQSAELKAAISAAKARLSYKAHANRNNVSVSTISAVLNCESPYNKSV